MEREVLSWIESQPEAEQKNKNIVVTRNPQNDDISAMGDGNHLPSFKLMLESKCYLNNNQLTQKELFLPNLQNQTIAFPSDQNDSFLMQPLDSSSSSFLPPPPPPKSCFSPLFNDNGFDLGSQCGFLPPFMMENQASGSFSYLMGFSPQMSYNPEFPVELGTGFGQLGGAEASNAAPFSNKASVLKPLEAVSLMGAPKTLFQKQAVHSGGEDRLGSIVSAFTGLNYDSSEIVEIVDNNKNNNNDDDDDGGDDDEDEEDEDNGGVVGGNWKRKKKKGMPSKNLMAERRRRKKLNDRMYMLRSVVPKISKMDRASILGDAIAYMKELLRRISDLHIELESSSPGSSLPPSTSFQPLTPTPSTIPCLVKEGLCPSSVPSPRNQPAKVEVRVREGRAVNIHMYCARRQGLLLSTMRALDNLGLDVQQAVINCFNGFSLDVFRAEQCKEGQDVHPEKIKEVLLDTASFHRMM